MGQELIFNTLYRGAENAKHLQTICKEWGMSETNVKKIIREARLHGIEICSGVEGYWLAADIVDRNNFLHSLKKQAFERIKTAKGINNATDDIKGHADLNIEQMEVSDNKWNG